MAWKVAEIATMRADRGPDAALARVAARQYGVVTTAQARACGLTRDAVLHRVRLGRLHRLHVGVLAVGHPAVPFEGRVLAAVLACGPAAYASHLAAAALYEIVDGRPAAGAVDVTVAGRAVHGRDGIRVHHALTLTPADVRVRRCIPVLAPARTLLGLAAVLPADDLDRAYERARTLRLVCAADVRALLERLPRHRGSAVLRRLVAERPALTRSAAERRLLDLVRRGGLPRPVTNVRLAGFEADMLWREHRLVVEVDGYAFHRGRAAFERDRRRDAELHIAGYAVIRVTWRRLVDEPEAVLVLLTRALARSTPASDLGASANHASRSRGSEHV